MEDSRLIVEVEKYKILYDTRDKYYKDKRVNQRAWEEIATTLNEDDPDKCAKRWKQLRDEFVRSRRKRPSSGSAGGTARDFKFEKEMAFLIPHMQPRSSRSTLGPAPSPLLEHSLPEPDVPPMEEDDEVEQFTQHATPLPQRSTPTPLPAQCGTSPTPLLAQSGTSPTTPTLMPRRAPHPRVQALIGESATQSSQPPPRPRERRRPVMSAVEEQLLDIITEPQSNPPPHVPTIAEENYHFAMAMVSKLNRLSERAQGQAQMHILGYLTEMLERERPQLPPQGPLHHQPHTSAFYRYPPTQFHHTHVRQQHETPPPTTQQDRPFLEDLADPEINPPYHRM
ncbi:hypothetical protein ACEWY4_010428 [Coilia grayii]|uniref:MADF domain-containing protein n=1 Tax=Coilia grayii TaxID=363190 RepID=A0ABD1K1W1_9TELE